YSRRLTMLLLLALFTVIAFSTSPSTLEMIAFYFGLMFLMCLVVHGELARSKPAPAHLTLFYVLIAAGGALGGAFVTLLCPLIFLKWSELWLALLLAVVLALAAMLRADGWRVASRSAPLAIKSAIASLIAASIAVTVFVDRHGRPLAAARNFFGVVQVVARHEQDPRLDHLALMNGRICHGLQFLDPRLRHAPTTYYGPESGAGLV